MAAGYNTTDDPKLKLAKKKAMGAQGQPAGAMGPPTIVPPIMPDWAAAVRAAQQGGDAIPAINYNVGRSKSNEPETRTLEFRHGQDGPYGMAGVKPIPNYDPSQPQQIQLASSSPGRGMGGGAPAPSPSGSWMGVPGTPDNAALAKQIALREAPAAQRTELGQMDTDAIRRMQTVDALMRAPGITPEQKAALQAERLNLVSSRRDIGGDMDLLNRSMVTPTPAQTPSQIVAGRDQINLQLQSVAEQKRKAILAQMAANPAQGAALQPELEDAYRIASEANTVLPRYGGGTGAARGLEDPRVTAIAQAQKERVLREQGTQATLGGLVDQRAEQRSAALAEQVKRRALASRLGTAEGERALAETEGATAQAKFAADPQTMQSELAAKQAIAKSAALKAQAESGAYGGANAVTAGIAGQRRQAALSMAGLDTPEAYNQFKQQATGHLQNLLNLDDGQRAFDNLNQQTIPVLQEIAANDPTEASRIARDLLGQLPETGIVFGDVMKGPAWGGFNVAKKALLGRRVNAARQALMQFASGA